MSVQVALKRYIYEGVCSPQKDYRDEKERKKAKGKAQLYTLMVSAYWHGFYPGYFITFFHWALIVLINQEIYRIRVKS